MRNNSKKIYKFHSKMDTKMKDNLSALPLYKRMGNLSQLITRIISLLSPGMELMHLRNEQKLSKYEFVNDDKGLERKSVFVFLPDYLYRNLKLMHQDLNYYSMAQLLRWLLGRFLEFAKLYGNHIESRLLALYRNWKAKRTHRKFRYKPVEELLRFIYTKPRISSFLTLYSRKFQPISIYRL